MTMRLKRDARSFTSAGNGNFAAVSLFGRKTMFMIALLLAQAAVPAPVPVAPGAAVSAAPGAAGSARGAEDPASAAAPPIGAPEGSARDVYAKRCTICHGEDGKGHTKKGKQLRVPDFTTAKFQKETKDDEIIDIIENGNKKRKMPAFKSKLTMEQIHGMVPFVRSFAKQ